ncbi:MAG: hypothetical protein ABJP45_13240 [Cyclobacteriaceae bacterium]
MAEVDIIDLWNKGKRQSSIQQEIDVEELITKKSKTPLYWIKLILWVEFWLNLISLPVVFIFYRDDDPFLYGVLMPIALLIYLVYYQFLIQKIKAFDYTINVRNGLRKLYGYLNFFFLHYKVLVWLFIPLGYVYGTYVALQKDSPDEVTTKSWLIIIVTGVVVSGLISLLFNFLVNLIYGRKIKRLKGIVQELESEDAH